MVSHFTHSNSSTRVLWLFSRQIEWCVPQKTRTEHIHYKHRVKCVWLWLSLTSGVCVFPVLAAPRFTIFQTNGLTHCLNEEESERQNTAAFQFIQVLDDFCCGIICVFLTDSLRCYCAHFKNRIFETRVWNEFPAERARQRGKIYKRRLSPKLYWPGDRYCCCRCHYRLHGFSANNFHFCNNSSLPLCHK